MYHIISMWSHIIHQEKCENVLIRKTIMYFFLPVIPDRKVWGPSNTTWRKNFSLKTKSWIVLSPSLFR